MSIAISYTIVSQNGSQSGTSPHCFYLDAKATTSSLYSTATEQYRKLLYKIDWQDTDASGTATWAYGADTTRLKNLSKGATAVHVYRITEGGGNKTRTPIVRVTDGVSIATASSIALTVVDPAVTYSGSNTICVSPGATPVAGVDGVPAGAAVQGGITTYEAARAFLATGRRVLIKHDEVLTQSGISGYNNFNGPFCVGKYGSGADPILRAAANNTTFFRYGNTGGPYNDVTYSDLTLDGAGFTGVDGATREGDSGPNAHYNSRHDGILFLRIIGTGLARGIWTMQQSYIHTVECELTTKTGADTANVIYGEWLFSSILGSLIVQTETADLGNGMLRNGHPMGMVLSNTTFRGAQAGRQHLKLHNALVASPVAENFILSCNKIEAYSTSGDVWWVQIAPDNSSDHQELGTFIVEDNWFVSSIACDVMLQWSVGHGTVRNNFFEMSLALAGSCRPMNQYWFGPAAQPSIDDVDVYNNTAHSTRVDTSSGPGDGFSMIAVDAQFGAGATHPSTNTRIRNNIAYAPNFTTRTMIYDPYASVAGGDQSNNTFVSTRANTWVSSDGVGTGTFTVPSDFKLRSTAPEKGAGTDTTIQGDFYGNYRIGVTNDKGFHQVNAGADPFGVVTRIGALGGLG